MCVTCARPFMASNRPLMHGINGSLIFLITYGVYRHQSDSSLFTFYHGIDTTYLCYMWMTLFSQPPLMLCVSTSLPSWKSNSLWSTWVLWIIFWIFVLLVLILICFYLSRSIILERVDMVSCKPSTKIVDTKTKLSVDVGPFVPRS